MTPIWHFGSAAQVVRSAWHMSRMHVAHAPMGPSGMGNASRSIPLSRIGDEASFVTTEPPIEDPPVEEPPVPVEESPPAPTVDEASSTEPPAAFPGVSVLPPHAKPNTAPVRAIRRRFIISWYHKPRWESTSPTWACWQQRATNDYFVGCFFGACEGGGFLGVVPPFCAGGGVVGAVASTMFRPAMVRSTSARRGEANGSC